MSSLSLLTTLRYAPRRSEPHPLLDYHVARLLHAWWHFVSLAQPEPREGLEQDIRRQVQLACERLDETKDWRVRVLLHSPSAEIQVEAYPMPPDSPDFHYNLESFITAPSQTGKPITLDSQPSNLLTSRGVGDVELDPADLYRYKTTRRDAYDEAAKRGKTAYPDAQIFDTLLYWPSTSSSSPTENLITELTTSNIAIHSPSATHNAQWITPRFHPDGPPFLCGVMRTYLLSRDEVREEDITVEQFERLVRDGRRVVGMNGLRGIWLANPIHSPEHLT